MGDREVLRQLLAPWPLTARADELDQVLAAVADGARAVFLVGEAGCGKSRLADEVGERMAADGWHVAAVRATEATRPTPLGAVRPLLDSQAGHSAAAAFDAVRGSLAADAAGRPVAVHVDDAHSLDPSSALVLAGLAESGAARLIVTARTGTTMPDPLTALRAAPDVPSLAIGPLSRPAVAELLEQVLGGPLDGLAESALADLSRGNPLSLRELALGGVADGSLVAERGVWQLRGDLPAAEALGDRVRVRLAALRASALEALELVSLGEPLGVDLLEGLVPTDALEEVEDAGLLRVDVSGRRHEARLDHPLHGEVVRHDMGPERRRTHSARLATAIGERGARRVGDLGQIVRWQIDAGTPPDPEDALRSAQIARHHNDWLTAARLARVAHDGGLADAANLLAESHYAIGEFEEGDVIAEPALADPGRLSDAALTSLHRTRAGVWFFGSRDPEQAEAAVVAAAERVTEPDLRDMLGYARAAMCMWSGRVREARQLAEPLLAAPDPKVQVQAAIAVETVLSTAGPADEAIELAQHWYGVHAGLADLNGTNSPAFHLLIQTEALVNAGQLERAEQLGRMGYDLAVASHNRIAQMWFARELGQATMLRGDAHASRRWLIEQVALCRQTAWNRPLALGLSELAVAEVHLGDGAAARAALAERDALGVPVIPLFATEAARGTAWTQAADGDLDGALATLATAIDHAERSEIWLLAALARLDAFRLGAPDQAGGLAAAAERVGSRIVDAAARWAAAAERADGPALDAAVDEWEALGMLRHAAEAAATARRIHLAAEDQRAATAAGLRADRLRQRSGAPVDEGGDQGPAPAGLTPREREIAVLTAEGNTAKQVAAELSLSSRTVSNHLQSVYAKLGISRRAELADALAQLAIGAPEPPSPRR